MAKKGHPSFGAARTYNYSPNKEVLPYLGYLGIIGKCWG